MQYGICVGFNFDGEFFDERVVLPYDQRQLEVIVGKPHDSHRVRAVCDCQRDYKAVFHTISHFLSELSWKLRIQLYADICVHGTGLPDCSFRNHFPRSERYFIHDFKQEVFANDQHLALGFYREGYSSNSPFYRFLSFYKILEIPFNDGSDKGKWAESLIPRLTESKDSLLYLRRNGVNYVAKWIFEEGRNGLSHAYKKRQGTVVDITAFDHWQNIVWANKIVQEMAEMTMIEKLAIPKRW
jgi:hypothetical protein